jgi:hypothetical protein
MQRGSSIRKRRKRDPDIWLFRWSKKGPRGKRVYCKRVIGTIEEYPDAEAVGSLQSSGAGNLFGANLSCASSFDRRRKNWAFKSILVGAHSVIHTQLF